MNENNEHAEVKLGRPARISRDDIAEAALAIGLDRVTMQKVGAALGVDHSSLYRHVKGRGDILFAAADLAIARLDWRMDIGDWRLVLQRAAEAVWDLYDRNPGLAEVIRSLDATPPAGIRAFAETVQRLEQLGFAEEDAAVIVDSIMDMTSDSIIGWHRIARGNAAAPSAMHASWKREAGESPQFARPIARMAQVLDGDPKAWWRRKLNLLLDGAETALRRRNGA